MFKGILFVLLALCLNKAYARDTSSSTVKVKTVLIVSVLDDVAFTKYDVDSLKRFVSKKLPDHEVIVLSTYASRNGLPVLSQEAILNAQKDIQDQIAKNIFPHNEITHFVLMDHGNTWSEGEHSKTSFGVFNTIGVNKIHMDFVNVFYPLAGKFSDNAFVMLEACSTACGDVKWSEKRFQHLMNFFRIKNGTLFAANRDMISVGYEWGYHLKKISKLMYHPFVIPTALFVGLGSEAFISAATGVPYDVIRGMAMSLGIDVVFSGISYLNDLFEKLSQKFNWGYLFKFKNTSVEKVYELNPYKNKSELYLKVEPKEYKIVPRICKRMFQ